MAFKPYNRRNGRGNGNGSAAKQRPTEVQTRVPHSSLSCYQLAALEALLTGSGHLVVEAVAGSGKTETILHLLAGYKRKNPGNSVLVAAFNTNIKDVLSARIPASVADVMTAHGLGFGFPSSTRKGLNGAPYGLTLHWNWEGGRKGNLAIMGPDSDFMFRMIQSQLPNGDDPETYSDIAETCRLVSLCKTRLAGLTLDGKLDPASVQETIARHDMTFLRYTEEEIVAAVLFVLQQTKKQPSVTTDKGKEVRAVTFDDQIWLPLMHGWELPKYDLILIDEAQDLSPARVELFLRCLKPSGRIVAVGDRFQAIYRFAGADVDALPCLIERLGAEVKPLSVTYRSAKRIVAEAQQYNPDIEARPDAPEGTVDNLDVSKLAETAKAGDAILSRTNAPLVSLFFGFAKTGKKVVMLGREYGAMLAYRIKGWQKYAKKHGILFNGDAVLDSNARWLSEALEKLGNKGGTAAQRYQDEADTIFALSQDLPVSLSDERAVEEMLDRCYSMFSTDGKGEDVIALSSTHKFKGDERDRIFMLTETYKPGASEEERNLAYVAVTRAREHLTYTTGLKRLQRQAAAS